VAFEGREVVVARLQHALIASAGVESYGAMSVQDIRDYSISIKIEDG
jgi:hypothetical protein